MRGTDQEMIFFDTARLHSYSEDESGLELKLKSTLNDHTNIRLVLVIVKKAEELSKSLF
tara:strand:- start:1635 stop:1811 length:177 start_codon:yes stop_codon:yes gene_type:complete